MELRTRKQIRNGKLPGFALGTDNKATADVSGANRILFGTASANPLGLNQLPYGTLGGTISGIVNPSPRDRVKRVSSVPPGLPATKQPSAFDKISGQVGSIATQGIDFAGSLIGGFQYNKSADQLGLEAGTSSGNVGGIGYTRQNDVDSAAEMAEVSRSNTTNTLGLMGKGAALGSTIGSIGGPVGTVIGTGVGAVAGLVGGLFGGASRKRKAQEAIRRANQAAYAKNEFNRDVAMTQGLQQDNALLYGDNDSQSLYGAAYGKDEGEVYTANGKTSTAPNARVAGGEVIWNRQDGSAKVVEDGKFNQDSVLAQLKDNDVVLSQRIINPQTGNTLATDAIGPAKIIEQINRQSKDSSKLRGGIGRTTDKLQQQLASDVLNNLSDMQKQIHTVQRSGGLPGFAEGGEYTEGWLSNAVPHALGTLGGVMQYLDANGQQMRVPETYASNPYEGRALNQLASLRVNPYPIMNQLRDAEARQYDQIRQSGGLSTAQRYLGRVAGLNATQANIANMMQQIQTQNNAYRTAYANAALQTGAQDAQRIQNANQYREQMAAAAHAARLQGKQMGIRNVMDYINSYASNEFKRRQFNRMYGLYAQDVANRGREIQGIIDNLNWNRGVSKPSTNKGNASLPTISRPIRNMYGDIIMWDPELYRNLPPGYSDDDDLSPIG